MTKILISVLLVFSAFASGQPQSVATPVTITRNGISFTDQYPWLEHTGSPEVRAWTAAQNDYFEAHMAIVREKYPALKKIREYQARTATLSPRKRGNAFYLLATTNNSVRLYRFKDLNLKPDVVLYQDSIVPGKKMHLRGYFPSAGSRYLAYLVNDNGSDQIEIRFKSLVPGPEYPDVLTDAKIQNVRWNRDLGIFYIRTHRAAQFSRDSIHSVFYHVLGTPQSADKLVFDGSKSGSLSLDIQGGKVWIFEQDQIDGSQNFYMGDLNGILGSGRIYFEKVLENKPEGFRFLRYSKGRIYFSSDQYNWGDVRYFELADPAVEHVVIPQSYMNLLASAEVYEHYIFCRYRSRDTDFINVFDADGTLLQHLEAPKGIRLSLAAFDEESATLYYTGQGYTQPKLWFRLHISTGENGPFYNSLIKAKPPLFPDGYLETTYITYKARDGQDIPMTIVSKKGTVRDGNNPVLLKGYGGFGVVTSESYDNGLMWFLEQGGVFAFANIRGGNENGTQWHTAAVGRTKTTTVNDFIDAAEFLIREKYTNPQKLAITGGSQGGLLVGAAMTQRPELFRVAVPQMGIFDMSRYDQYTGGSYLKKEYGDPENKDDYAALMAYSPLQHIAEGVNYPVVLLVAADNDDRVTPFQSWKFAAALQQRPAQKNPVFVKTIENAGHYGNSDPDGWVSDNADFYSFILYHLTE